MDIQLILADYAQAADGKINLIGGWWGWTTAAPLTPPMAVAILVSVPWDQTNQAHAIVIELVDQDGQPVKDADDRRVRAEVAGRTGRPAEATPGADLRSVLAINVGPLPLEAGGRYEWRAVVDGQLKDQVAFSVRGPA